MHVLRKTFYPFETSINTLVCGWRFEMAHDITVHTERESISLRFSSNSEALASELLENIEEMLLTVVNN